jgi:hypothetical protein
LGESSRCVCWERDVAGVEVRGRIGEVDAGCAKEGVAEVSDKEEEIDAMDVLSAGGAILE